MFESPSDGTVIGRPAPPRRPGVVDHLVNQSGVKS